MKGLTIKSTPLPRWLVLCNSAIVIGISAAFAGLVLGTIVVTWNPCSMLGMLVLLPFPLAVGGFQYAAGFRNNRKAAKAVKGLHVCGIILLGLLIYGMILALNNWKEVSVRACVEVGLVVGAFIYCGFCCWMNARMENYLQKAEEAADLPNALVGTGRFQFTLRELLGIITVLSIMASFASYIIHDARKEFSEHISRAEVPANLFQLPAGTEDVCFCLGDDGALAYEFTIDEPGFFRWAENILAMSSAGQDVSVSKIPQTKHEMIKTYRELRYHLEFRLKGYSGYALVKDGYFCEVPKDGKVFKILYDSANKRAYYYGKVLSSNSSSGSPGS